MTTPIRPFIFAMTRALRAVRGPWPGTFRLPQVVHGGIALAICVASGCGKSIKSERREKVSEGQAVVSEPPVAKGAGLPSVCREVSAPAPITGDGFSDLAAVLENSWRLLSGETGLRQLCLQCQPRDLARIQCLKVELGSVNEICSNTEADSNYSDPVIKCRSGKTAKGEQAYEVFDLKPNRLESALVFLPLVSTIVESQIAKNLVEGSRQKLIADTAVEFARSHARGVILGIASEPAADYVVEKIGSYLQMSGKSLTDEKKGEVRAAVISAFADVANLASQSDRITPEQLQSMTEGLYQAVPELQKYQFVLPVLFTSGSADVLQQAIGSSINADALKALFDVLQ